MLQILIAIMGLFALVKGSLKVTRSRSLTAGKARLIGVGLLLVAAVPMVLEDLIGTIVMVGGMVALAAAGYLMTTPNELADEIPMKGMF